MAQSAYALNALPRQAARPPTANQSSAQTPSKLPTDPARQIEAVRKAFDAGHTAEALRLANSFSAQQKTSAEFHTQLGVVLTATVPENRVFRASGELIYRLVISNSATR